MAEDLAFDFFLRFLLLLPEVALAGLPLALGTGGAAPLGCGDDVASVMAAGGMLPSLLAFVRPRLALGLSDDAGVALVDVRLCVSMPG